MLLGFAFILIPNRRGFAQTPDDSTYVLEGTVLDRDSQKSLLGAVVSIDSLHLFKATNLEGFFQFNGLKSPIHTLRIHFLGFEDKMITVDARKKQKLIIELEHDIHLLEEVTVTGKEEVLSGTRTLAQTRVDVSRLSSRGTGGFASALESVQGVSMSSTGSNVQLPIIHGLQGNRLVILNNGIKHGFQNWGSEHAPEIDLATVSRITVVKGAAGVRFGPEAMAGAIIIESNPMDFNTPLNGGVSSGFESNGWGHFLRFEMGQGGDDYAYFVGGNHTRFGDRRAPNYVLSNTGKSEQSINGGFRYRFKDWETNAYYSYVQQNLGILRGAVAESGNLFARSVNASRPLIINSFSFDIDEPNQENKHHLAKTDVVWRYRPDAQLLFRLGGQLNQRREFDVRRNAERPIIDLELLTSEFQVEWELPDQGTVKHRLGINILYQDNNNNPGTGTTAFIPNYNTVRFSAFALENRDFGKWAWEMGLRADLENNSVRGRQSDQSLFADDFELFNISGTMGISYSLSKSETLKTNIGTAWRTPNMAELFSFGQHGFRSSFGLLRYEFDAQGQLSTSRVIKVDDDRFDVERGIKWVGEYELQTGDHIVNVTGYLNYMENFIFERPISIIGTIRGPLPVYIFDQSNALFLGSDLSWFHHLSDHLHGTIGFNALYSRNLSRNEVLIDQPPLSIQYVLDYELKDIGFFKRSQIRITPRYTFRQFQAPRTINPQDLIDGEVSVNEESEIFDFKKVPNGYFLLDVQLSSQIAGFHLALQAQNLFNSTYRNYLNQMRLFADELGINITAKITYNF